MLNELMLVRNGLASINPGSLEPIHKCLSEPGKANLLRVILSEENGGCITELECLSDNKNKLYWTQGKGNSNQFPAVKLPFPLRPGGIEAYCEWKEKNKRPSDQEHLDAINEIRNKHSVDILKYCKKDSKKNEGKPAGEGVSEEQGKPADSGKAEIEWPNYRDKLKERANIYQELQDEANIVSRLINTFLAIESKKLLAELDEKLWDQCQKNPESGILKLAALIWFASGNLKNGMIPDGRRPTLLLDMLASDRFSSAANKKYQSKISSLLFEHETARNIGTCAITGEDENLVSNTFPSAKCEHLGKVTIFSRKKETYTFQRYGQKGAASMPVSAKLADEMASALRCLTDTDKKGITCDILPGETGNSGDLLVAFCRALPDAKLMPLVTQDSEIFDEEDYETETKQICLMFRGENVPLDDQIDFLIIRKISDGVQKVIFSSSQTLENLQNSAETWVSDCKNIPPIQLAFFKKGEKIPYFKSPKPISPKQVARLFGHHYNRSLRRSNVSGLPFAEVIRLFLYERHETGLITRLLNQLFKQYANLLEQAALKKTDPAKHHRDALHVITAMGLLLNKINRGKEVYMKDFAYKLGQFCAALDEIHIGYCVSERQGQIPSRLIGNQAYAAAISSPLKALEITAQRSAVYQAWARKVSERPDTVVTKIQSDKKMSPDEKNKKTKKIMKAVRAFRWLHKHCGDLRQTMSIRKLSASSATDKAELLLGYLAGRPIEKSKQANGGNKS